MTNDTVTARIFADTLPEPTVQELKLRIDVENLTVQAAEILNEIIIPTAATESPANALPESANVKTQGVSIELNISQKTIRSPLCSQNPPPARNHADVIRQLRFFG